MCLDLLSLDAPGSGGTQEGPPSLRREGAVGRGICKDGIKEGGGLSLGCKVNEKLKLKIRKEKVKYQ